MVVLILLILWAAALTPLWLKRRRERQGQGSIETFHHQLRLLGRAGPKLVSPAHRLETAWSHSGVAPGETGYPALSSVPFVAGVGGMAGVARTHAAPVGAASSWPPRSRPSLVLLGAAPVDPDGAAANEADPPLVGLARSGGLAPLAREAGGSHGDAPQVGRAVVMAQRARAERRRQARRRRAHIVVGLACAAVLTGALGSIHALHVLWALSALAVLGVCGCVALAAYAEMLEAERRALRPIVPVQAPMPVRPPVAPGWGVSPLAARSGYPGAWDDPAPASRAMAGG